MTVLFSSFKNTQSFGLTGDHEDKTESNYNTTQKVLDKPIT